MFDCAVIGAGYAGLVAAQELKSRGKSVVVLEARDRVGGRVENIDLPDGSYLEMGGQWVGPGFDVMQELIRKYGLETIGVPSPGGKFIVRIRGEAIEASTDEDAPELNPFEMADLGQGLLRLRRLARRYRDDEVWRKANDAWLRQGMRRWAQTNFRTKSACARFEEVYTSAFLDLSDETTLLEGLGRVLTGPDLESMLATDGKLMQERVKGGAWQLARVLADELGDSVRLGCAVVGVRYDESQATVVLSSGEEVAARTVINTMPPRLAAALDYDPPLPQWRIDENDKMSPGNIIKAYLLFEQPFWRERGLSGQSSADEGAVRVTFDTTLADATQGHMMGFFAGGEAQSLAKRTPQIRQRAFLESLRAAFGEVPKPVGYAERLWAAEPYSKGCHGAHFSPGIWSVVGPTLAEPVGPLYWAGAEYATKFNGYMEGAIRSGQATAAQVLAHG